MVVVELPSSVAVVGIRTGCVRICDQWLHVFILIVIVMEVGGNIGWIADASVRASFVLAGNVLAERMLSLSPRIAICRTGPSC